LAITIELPHVGESVVEGTIGKWLKQPGDQVRRYEPLVEVVTDKVTMEVPSPVSGSLLKILAQEGETIPMGAPIAEMESSDPPPPRSSPALPPDPSQAAASQPAAKSQPEISTAETVRPAGTTGYLLHNVGPVGPTGGGPNDPAAIEATEAAVGRSSSNSKPARHSPAVRRLANENDIDLAQVSGTGMGGRITRDDVLAFIKTGPKTGPRSAPAPTSPAAAQPVSQTAAAPAKTETAGDEEYIPLTPVRRMIADAMVRSVSQIPHAWSTVEVDVTNLVTFRNQAREDFQRREGVSLTYLPFVIKAVVESLKEHPTLNSSWGGDKIILKKRINMGIAVAAPVGLMVPVIHDADRLSIAGLAAALQGITLRARDNKLTLDDVQGGTFTLNNTGALGSTISQPIINFPQAAILTTEAIQKRPVVRDDAIAIRSMMNLCMSFDHRINDGAESGGFLQAVKSRLESMGPDTPVY